MKILRIVRTFDSDGNKIYKDLFEFKSGEKNFTILRPDEQSNKYLDKKSLLKPRVELTDGSSRLFSSIWCYSCF